MSFNLESRFRIVEDTVTVPDPWGYGVDLVILCSDSKKHSDWLLEQRQKSPLLLETSRRFTLAQLEAAAAPDAEGSDEEVVPLGDLETWKKSFSAASREMVAAGKLDLGGLLRGGTPEQLDVCVHLLRDFPGLTGPGGGRVKRTDESARQLLTSEVVIDEGYGEGLTLGEALQRFVVEISNKHSVARAKYLVGAEKNSEASSAGN